MLISKEKAYELLQERLGTEAKAIAALQKLQPQRVGPTDFEPKMMFDTVDVQKVIEASMTPEEKETLRESEQEKAGALQDFKDGVLANSQQLNEFQKPKTK